MLSQYSKLTLGHTVNSDQANPDHGKNASKELEASVQVMLAISSVLCAMCSIYNRWTCTVSSFLCANCSTQVVDLLQRQLKMHSQQQQQAQELLA